MKRRRWLLTAVLLAATASHAGVEVDPVLRIKDADARIQKIRKSIQEDCKTYKSFAAAKKNSLNAKGQALAAVTKALCEKDEGPACQDAKKNQLKVVSEITVYAAYIAIADSLCEKKTGGCR